jgi:SAM-dependent methyltransferase
VTRCSQVADEEGLPLPRGALNRLPQSGHMVHAGVEFWDQFYRRRLEAGNDLDWDGLWITPFLVPLWEAGVRTILELGCGTGNDAARLAGEGYSVTATDLSGEAVEQARAKFGSLATFLVADMTEPLPFPDRSFDAVMSNVAVHMFPDDVTRAVFAEVGRLVRTGGVFLFHVNALEDRPLRARRLPSRELAPDFVVEESGQTMHFFSEPYLRELLWEWRDLDVVSVPIPHRETGEPYKHVWRGIARR